MERYTFSAYIRLSLHSDIPQNGYILLYTHDSSLIWRTLSRTPQVTAFYFLQLKAGILSEFEILKQDKRSTRLCEEPLSENSVLLSLERVVEKEIQEFQKSLLEALNLK
jgi:hypothetical protein